MIIVHVHQTYWPVLGGCEVAMQKICEELARMGHEVHIITSTLGAENRPRYEETNGVHIHRIKAWTLYYPDLTIPREVPRDLLKKADIVHGWSQNSLFTYSVCKEAKMLGKPTVVYFLGVDYLKDHYNPLIRIFGYPYQRLLTRKVLKITDLALTTNEYDKRILKEKYSVDSVVVPHGVDEMYLKLPNMAHKFREKYGIEGKIIAYIGRIHPTKGLDLLVKAFVEVAKYMPDAILVIVGKGDEKYLNKCLKLAEKFHVRDRVRYLGYLDEYDKIALIDASKVVVLPTRHAGENYSLVVDEVLARKKPIIVTNKSQALQARVSSVSSCIIIPYNVNSLAEALIKVLQRKSEFNNASTKVSYEIISWSEVAKRLLEIYNRCIYKHFGGK